MILSVLYNFFPFKTISEMQERRRIAAIVHIQRIVRGREARKLAQGLTISRRAPITPKRPISSAATPPITPVRFREDGKDIGVVEMPEEKGEMASTEGNTGEAENTIAPSGDLVCNEVGAEGRGETIDTLEGDGIYDTDEAARGNAAICIQACSRAGSYS